MARQKTKAERLAEGVKKAVNAGHQVAVETVDFSDPNRPPTCLEIDFPILPVNQVAVIEGNSGKPIYQVSKWWARRRSSVFRSLLLSAAMKAPDDPLEAAKAVWDVYYANHQKKGALSHLKVVDPFMGGGTTLVEGSRLGMDMTGVDLNPVAWFVVKTELAQVDRAEVEALLEDVEAEVKPQIMPFYACDCPRGHKGKWTKISTGKVMGDGFDPLDLTPSDRSDYSYAGPETIYVFWAKHGPCQVTGCGHRTPVMSKPVMAVKKLSVKYWPYKCKSSQCQRSFDIEEQDARMAPGVPLVIAETERPHVVPSAEHDLSPPKKRRFDVACPHCGHKHDAIDLSAKAPKKKKVELSLLVHPQWLAGESSIGPDGSPFGGSVTDSPNASDAWHSARASRLNLVEVRGKLPPEIPDPLGGPAIKTGTEGGTSAGRGKYACSACGTVQNLLKSVHKTGRTPPEAAYAYQGYCPQCAQAGEAYGGRFFSCATNLRSIHQAACEWQTLKSKGDHERLVPCSNIRPGLETSVRTPLNKYHYIRWTDFHTPRQLLAAVCLLRAIEARLDDQDSNPALMALAAFQQFLRSFNSFCIWDIGYDKLAPMLSKNNLHPPSRPVEGAVFSSMGRGNWESCTRNMLKALEWKEQPWELVAMQSLPAEVTSNATATAKSAKASPLDPPRASSLLCRSSTDLQPIVTGTVDLVITDPPFGDIMQYGELSDFFYAWLRPVLRPHYPEVFALEHTPTAVEAVENAHRHGGKDEASGFYKNVLKECWSESFRVLKPGGILAFTFHHDKDGPWVAVLESLFEAGFYLEATYPIRGDETKGEGSTPGTFGAQKVEFDIIHVCRKRTESPRRVSWAKMRREILKEARRLQSLIEHHEKNGLPSGDIQVIKRGKALEYFSKHYGNVFEAEGQALSVKDAVLGVLQVLDEDANPGVELPPVTASPYTRQLLRMFRGAKDQPRDQIQKYLRGTGISPYEFENRGWIHEDNKVYYLTPFIDVAQTWHRKHRVGMVHDYDQAAFLIGACFGGSGIKAEDTLSNQNFKPHPALGSLLEWFSTHSADPTVRVAAGRADRLYRSWQARNRAVVQQLSLFADDGDDA